MAYDAAKLNIRDPTDAAWALAWARRFAGDRTEPEVHGDEEWLAELEADAVRVTATGGTVSVYYRPDLTAARVVGADPAWSSLEWLGDARVRSRSAAELAAAIRGAGRWVAELVEGLIAARSDVARVAGPGGARAPRAVF